VVCVSVCRVAKLPGLCVCVSVAVRCPAVPDWPHQTLDTHNNTYNTTVTFWCDVGYVLFDNTTARTLKCLADASWSADLPPCERSYSTVPTICNRGASTVRKFVFSNRVINSWNSPPTRCVNCNTVDTFKKYVSIALESETDVNS